jgi:hypothetical protein
MRSVSRTAPSRSEIVAATPSVGIHGQSTWEGVVADLIEMGPTDAHEDAASGASSFVRKGILVMISPVHSSTLHAVSVRGADQTRSAHWVLRIDTNTLRFEGLVALIQPLYD